MAGLYVHIPLRRAQRPYDDAYAVAPDRIEPSSYVEQLTAEMDRYREHPLTDAPMTSAYIGGGRPSLLSLDAVRRLLTAIASHYDRSVLEEVTMEVNPADASLEYLNGLRKLGVTRLSVDTLSFRPDDLSAADTPHSIDDIRRTIWHIRRAGFRRFSVDLLFGAPGQSLSRWKATLYRAVEHRLPHLTLHELASDAERHRADCLAFAMTFLKAKGYEQYELTHFARPGHCSQHQVNYYAHGNYLGLGPSADSFYWPDRSRPTAHRWSNVRNLRSYEKLLQQGKRPVAQCDPLDQSALAREYILLRLRTSNGLDLNRLEQHYGVSLPSRHSVLLDRLAREGLIRHDQERVQLTDRGRLLTNAIAQRLSP